MKYILNGFVVGGRVNYLPDKLYPTVLISANVCGDLKSKINPTDIANIPVPPKDIKIPKIGSKIKLTIEIE